MAGRLPWPARAGILDASLAASPVPVLDYYEQPIYVDHEECGACGGEGRFIEIIGVDYRDGGMIERGYTCEACGGEGYREVESTPMTLDDLEELEAEGWSP